MAYCVAQDLYNVFGKVNIRKWADADNTKASVDIDARIVWAIEFVESEINSRLSVIFTDLPFASVPTLIKNISAIFAGVALYQLPRADAEGEDAVNMVALIQQRGETLLDKIVMRKLPLNSQAQVSEGMEVVQIANENGELVS